MHLGNCNMCHDHCNMTHACYLLLTPRGPTLDSYFVPLTLLEPSGQPQLHCRHLRLRTREQKRLFASVLHSRTCIALQAPPSFSLFLSRLGFYKPSRFLVYRPPPATHPGRKAGTDPAMAPEMRASCCSANGYGWFGVRSNAAATNDIYVDLVALIQLT